MPSILPAQKFTSKRSVKVEHVRQNQRQELVLKMLIKEEPSDVSQADEIQENVIDIESECDESQSINSKKQLSELQKKYKLLMEENITLKQKNKQLASRLKKRRQILTIRAIKY